MNDHAVVGGLGQHGDSHLGLGQLGGGNGSSGICINFGDES